MKCLCEDCRAQVPQPKGMSRAAPTFQVPLTSRLTRRLTLFRNPLRESRRMHLCSGVLRTWPCYYEVLQHCTVSSLQHCVASKLEGIMQKKRAMLHLAFHEAAWAGHERLRSLHLGREASSSVPYLPKVAAQSSDGIHKFKLRCWR